MNVNSHVVGLCYVVEVLHTTKPHYNTQCCHYKWSLLSDVCCLPATQARMVNSGESCIAAKRFIVFDSIYDDFEKQFVELVEQLKVGDPMKVT